MKKTIKTELIVKDNKVTISRVGNVDYVSLTDIACFFNDRDPSGVIRNWMSNKNSFEFYSLWETLNNPNFNSVEMRRIKNDEVGLNRFTMTPARWRRDFKAIGILPSAGKYSIGTFAHPDIAFEFASWISVEFKLYLIKEFERLKQDEAYRRQIDWSVKRELAKTNYLIHTDAIKENIVPTLSEKQKKFVYADEADVLNVVLFGKTAKEWRDENQNLVGNMRDRADILHLVVLINLENLNAEMINDGFSQRERLEKLSKIAKRQLKLLTENQQIGELENGKTHT